MATNNSEAFAKIAGKLNGIRSCMFVTVDASGKLKGRPMATQDIEFDGSIWFMTDKRSAKCQELAANNRVSLEYAHSNGVGFVSIAGTTELLVDTEKIKEFWNPFYTAWFEGPDDPNITLIDVKVSRAEYWDNKAGKLGAIADMAVGALTGNQNTLDEHEVVTFE